MNRPSVDLPCSSTRKVTAAEEKIASQEMMIQQLTSALAKAREARSFPDPDRAPKQTEDSCHVKGSGTLGGEIKLMN